MGGQSDRLVPGAVEHAEQAGARLIGRLGDLHGRGTGIVGQREQDPRQRDPVGDRVVHPEDECLAGAQVRRDQVDVPQRARPVQGLADQVGDERLQLRTPGRCRQLDGVQVCLDVEVRSVLPPDAVVLDRALA